MSQRRKLRVPTRRQVRVTIAADGGDDGSFDARVLQYNVLDDYNTKFAAGSMTESLKRKLPKIAWGHDWREPIGRWVDYKDDKQFLTLTGQLDLERHPNGDPIIPRAHQAYQQLRNTTIDEFSIGFVPEEWRVEGDDPDDWDAPVVFTRCRLDEASLVIAGAVPGTELLAVRSRAIIKRAGQLIDKELAAGLLVDLYQGNVDLADALSTLKNADPVDLTTDPNPEGVPDSEENEDAETEKEIPAEEFQELNEDIDAALALLAKV